jgi:hypothetical protein
VDAAFAEFNADVGADGLGQGLICRAAENFHSFV